MLQQPDLRALLTPAMLQQSRGPSRFSSTGTTPGMHDYCSTGTPTYLQQQAVPNALLQQESVSYLGANVGLLADASTLAAAAAAVAHNGPHGAGLHSCHTPLPGSQTIAFAGEAMCGSHLGAAAAAGLSAPAMPQQHHWLNLHRQHFSGSTGSLPGLASGSMFVGGADFCTGGNLVTGLVGDASPCGTPTYLQQGLPGPAPVMGTAAWCREVSGSGSAAGGARSSAWW